MVDFSYSRLDTPRSLLDDGGFSVRWRGLVRALAGGLDGLEEELYTVRLTAADERVRLWLSHSLLVDQWSSLQSLTCVGGGGVMGPVTVCPERLLHLEVEYKKDPGGEGGGRVTMAEGSGIRLTRRKTSISPSAFASAEIARAHLFAVYPIAAAPWRVRVEPNAACAARSLMRGAGLTIATAGMPATFCIQSRDAYSTLRSVGADRFVVKLYSDACQSPAPGTSADVCCRVLSCTDIC